MNKIFAVLGVIILLLLVIIIIPHNTVSNTAINTYLITLKNTPSGNGMYQQLININLSYPYGINSNGSNILFKDGSNNTFLYAWIQSINATNLQVWIKNYNNSILIEMMILPSFENLFSATGYLGEAPELSSVYGEYFNALQVFNYAWDFAGTTFPSDWGVNGVNYNVSNGLYISYSPTWSYMRINPQIVSLNSEILADVQFGSYASGSQGRLDENDGTLSPNGIQSYFQYESGATVIASNNATKSYSEAIPVNTNYNVYGLYINETKTFLNFNGNIYTVDNPYLYSSSDTFDIGLAGDNPNNYENVSWIVVPSLSDLYMPTFTIAPIGTAPNPLYLSNSFSISNILLMDGKVKL